jgi:16S rRNA processing protein RimM
MNVESCFQLGYIIKPHGLQGALLLYLDTDHPEDYETMESVFVEIKQKLVPFFVKAIQVRENRAIVHFENVDSIQEAERLKGLSLYLPLDQLSPLGEGQFYYHDVINFMIVDAADRKIGKIINILELNGNDLFTVDHQGQEVLIPVQDDFIIKVDHDEGIIYMQLPEGLLNVYLK